MKERFITSRLNAVCSELCLEKGIHSLDLLLQFLKRLPYKRISDKEDLRLVVSENRGTCSSKHALVKQVAEEQKWNSIKLLLVIYKMSQSNTPGIGDLLDSSPLDFIPEAHTILSIDNKYVDITFPHSDFSILQPDVILYHEIAANQSGSWKKDFHQNWLRS